MVWKLSYKTSLSWGIAFRIFKNYLKMQNFFIWILGFSINKIPSKNFFFNYWLIFRLSYINVSLSIKYQLTNWMPWLNVFSFYLIYLQFSRYNTSYTLSLRTYNNFLTVWLYFWTFSYCRNSIIIIIMMNVILHNIT